MPRATFHLLPATGHVLTCLSAYELTCLLTALTCSHSKCVRACLHPPTHLLTYSLSNSPKYVRPTYFIPRYTTLLQARLAQLQAEARAAARDSAARSAEARSALAAESLDEATDLAKQAEGPTLGRKLKPIQKP